jgi:hypothetical protein
VLTPPFAEDSLAQVLLLHEVKLATLNRLAPLTVH